MNRAQRRKLGKLSPAYDGTIDGDRRFFVRHVDRAHRVRFASEAEVEENASLGALVDCPAGLKWFVVVRQLAPGFRLRLFFRGSTERDTDLSEADAAAIWAGIETDQTRRIQMAGAHVWGSRR